MDIRLETVRSQRVGKHIYCVKRPVNEEETPHYWLVEMDDTILEICDTRKEAWMRMDREIEQALNEREDILPRRLQSKRKDKKQ